MSPSSGAGVARSVVARLREVGGGLAVAESLTGGALCSAVVSVPGASQVLRGGLVAYSTQAKELLLGVPHELLQAHGAVHPDVAAAMAAGAAARLDCRWGLATTGVAGPGPQDGHPAGTVHLAVHGPLARTRSLLLPGDREQVRRSAVQAALELLLECLRPV